MYTTLFRSEHGCARVGHGVLGCLFKIDTWAALKETLPEWLRKMMAEWQAVASDLDARERRLRAELEAEAPKDLPKGIGALTWVVLTREILDWSRFENRRQVASYTGLCPGVARLRALPGARASSQPTTGCMDPAKPCFRNESFG